MRSWLVVSLKSNCRRLLIVLHRRTIGFVRYLVSDGFVDYVVGGLPKSSSGIDIGSLFYFSNIIIQEFGEKVKFSPFHFSFFDFMDIFSFLDFMGIFFQGRQSTS